MNSKRVVVATVLALASSGLSAEGVEIGLGYKGDFVGVLSGGARQTGGFLGNLDLNLDLDFDKLAGLGGFSAHFYVVGNHGFKPSEAVGDGLGSSNIEAPSTLKLYEAYLKQSLSERLSLLAGFRDLNADFYALESAGIFINGSFGIGPSLSQTGSNGPSIFPNTALALSSLYEKEDQYFRAGVFNAQAGDVDSPYGTQLVASFDEGLLLIGEFGLKSGAETMPRLLAAGVWTYSKKAPSLLAESSARALSWGAYLLGEQGFSARWTAFAKLGYAASDANAIRASTEWGLNLRQPFAARADDVVGLATAWTFARQGESEGVIELLYRISIANNFFLVPDLQYALIPGEIDPAFVGLLRVEISL